MRFALSDSSDDDEGYDALGYASDASTAVSLASVPGS